MRHATLTFDRFSLFLLQRHTHSRLLLETFPLFLLSSALRLLAPFSLWGTTIPSIVHHQTREKEEKQQDFREWRKRTREGEQLAENIFLHSQSHFLPSSLLFASYCIFTVLCSSSRSARFFSFPFVDLTNTQLSSLTVTKFSSDKQTKQVSRHCWVSNIVLWWVVTFSYQWCQRLNLQNTQPLVLNLRKPFQHQMRISCIEDMRIKTLFFHRYFLHLLILP